MTWEGEENIKSAQNITDQNTLPVSTGAKAEARFQHLRALPSVYDLIMLELRNEVYLVWCCFFRLMLLTFLVGVWGGIFLFQLLPTCLF